MSNEIRRIEEPPEVRWAANRSLLLTLRLALDRIRTDPDQAYDLLVLAYGDARDIY
jgi:hypothetical protein